MEASEAVEPTPTETPAVGVEPGPSATGVPEPATPGEPQPEVTPEAAGEAGEGEEASPPDVSEALQQLNSRFDGIEQRLPPAEGESDFDLNSVFTGPEDDPGQQGIEQGPEGTGQLTEEQAQQEAAQRFIHQEAQRAIAPHFEQMEANRRNDGITALGKQYPELNTKELGEAVRDRMEAAGMLPDDGFPPDPDHVELVYKALKADAVASTETPAEAGGSQEGATLEQGAGPGAPEPEVDPVEQAYEQALGGGKNLGYDGLGGTR